jgi:hypothetical protein
MTTIWIIKESKIKDVLIRNKQNKISHNNKQKRIQMVVFFVAKINCQKKNKNLVVFYFHTMSLLNGMK